MFIDKSVQVLVTSIETFLCKLFREIERTSARVTISRRVSFGGGGRGGILDRRTIIITPAPSVTSDR